MPPIKQQQIIDNSVKKAFDDLNKAILTTIENLNLVVTEGKQINDTFKGASGIKEYNTALNNLNTNRKQAQTLTKDQIDLLKKEETLKQQVAKTTATQERAVQAKTRTQIQERKELERLAKEEEKQLKKSAQLTSAYARKSQALNEARKKAKDLGAEYGTLDSRFIKAQKSVTKMDKELKGIDSSLGQSQRNVGNYGDAISGLGGAFGGIVSKIQMATKAAWTFIATPLGAIIGAIGLAVLALTEYFKGSEEGQNRWNKIAAAGSVILGNLSDIVQAVGKVIYEAFENPQQAIADLWEFLKQNLMNRLTGVIDQFKAVGKVIEGVFELDWDQVKEGALDFGNATIQTMTGVEDAIGKAADAMSDLVEETKAEIAVSNELADKEALLNRLRREATVANAKNKEEIQKLLLFSRDLTNSDIARREAILKANEIKKQELLLNEKIKQTEYDIIKARNELSNSTIEDLQAEADAEAALYELRAANLAQLRELKNREITLDNEIRARITKSIQETNSSILEEAKKLDAEVEAMEQLELDNYLKSEEEKTKKLEEEEAKRAEIKKAAVNFAADIAEEELINRLASSAEGVEEEIRLNQEELDGLLENEALSEVQKQALQEEYARKEADLKTKKAKAERKDEAFKTIIAGIRASVQALPNLLLSGTILGQSIASSAFILSQPIPQFDKGTDSAPTGGFIAGEKRVEIGEHKGQSFLIDKPTYFGDEYAGMKITGGAETAKMLEQSSRQDLMSNIASSNNKVENMMIASAIDKSFARHSDKIVKAVRSTNKVEKVIDKKTTDLRNSMRN